MPIKIFDAPTWIKIGQPDLGSRMYWIDKKTKKRIYGKVTSIQFGHKKGIKLTIKK